MGQQNLFAVRQKSREIVTHVRKMFVYAESDVLLIPAEIKLICLLPASEKLLINRPKRHDVV